MMRMRVWLMALVFLVLSASNTLAEGFGLYEYSARGVALGGSVMARTPDPSAVAYNPALLTRLPGIQVMAGVTAVVPSGHMDWTDSAGNEGTTTLRDSLWPIPHFYYTHQLTDTLTFGVGEFTRYGLGFEYPHDWPGRFNIYEVSLLSASIAPNIAWKATDKLSLAVGPEIVYVDLDLKKRANVDLQYPAGVDTGYNMEVDSNIRGASDTGLGWNASMHYQFNDQWAFGFLYRSQVRVHAKGDVEYTMLGNDVPGGDPMGLAAGNYAQAFHDGKAHSTVILPDSFSGGLAFTPTPELSLEVGATYTRWSMFRDLNIHVPEPIGVSQGHKHWKDVWRLNAGVEYQALDWLTLRAGYVWDQSPMSEDYEDYLVPTDDRSIFSFGLGFHGEAWNLDLAYAYILPEGRSYDANAIGVMQSKTRDTKTQLFSVSLSYAF